MKNYLAVFIIFFVGYFLVDSIYHEMSKDKTPGKAKRLECQKRVTSFERAYSLSDIKHAQNLIEYENIDFSSHIEKSIYSESKLFEYITLDQTNKIFGDKLKSYVKHTKSDQKIYKLVYYIYENDKKNPGKKTAKSKLYAGYVVFEVKSLKNKTIYKVQIDFMDNKGADIKSSLDCTVESFMTYNK